MDVLCDSQRLITQISDARFKMWCFESIHQKAARTADRHVVVHVEDHTGDRKGA